MQQPVPRTRTVFRACVVNAVREGEALMTQLVQVTRGALTSQESELRDIARRNLASDALRLLNQHEAALVKAYPMALLEIFAEGPSAAKPHQADASGMDFGELTLVDDAEVQAQVELSRTQQLAVHATDAVLAELNALVSAAQGLHRVQPERNPLRPENYIRALQQIVAETGVAAPMREAWMQHMGDLLGSQLVDVYKRAAKSLREQGVRPVGYGVAAVPGSTAMGGLGRGGGSGYGTYGNPTGYGHSMGGASGYGGPSVYGRAGMASGWSGDPGPMGGMAPEAEEALLTVGILRQMLAGGGDPFEGPRGTPMVTGYAPTNVQPARMDAQGGGASRYGAPVGGQYANIAVSEAMEDIAQLERLVGRLAQSQPGYAPSGQGAPRSVYGVSYGGAAESPAMAAEVVARMVENISQDSRLLPPVQQAVQNLEPAIRKLVRHDPRFFSDGEHPARRLLDELTQRSLAFTNVEEPGFKRYMRLVDQAVNHLAQQPDVTSAAPFEAVLKALTSAWETQEKKQQARRTAEEKALLRAEQREMLAEKIAANIRALPDIGQVPADVMEFATGPWADVVARAQLKQPEGAEGDPGGYLALVPLLFWSVQPEQIGEDLGRMVDAIPGMLATLREGLATIGHPDSSTSAFIERLVLLHQQILDSPPPVVEPVDSAEIGIESIADDLPEAQQSAVDVNLNAAPTIDDLFVVGAWVDLVSSGKVMRTQLTWASPHKTLFLFTAADNSTQSMTRRTRDKLAAEGLLRVMSGKHVVDRAIDAMASSARGSSPPSTRR
ncbi:MAG: DUF1631 family protein [Giesbergeria sp.]|nr:DUF1631 family protein [Giesbergeria sp.]